MSIVNTNKARIINLEERASLRASKVGKKLAKNTDYNDALKEFVKAIKPVMAKVIEKTSSKKDILYLFRNITLDDAMMCAHTYFDDSDSESSESEQEPDEDDVPPAPKAKPAPKGKPSKAKPAPKGKSSKKKHDDESEEDDASELAEGMKHMKA
jgi:hypothetical protein